jgi:hypothetical protein
MDQLQIDARLRMRFPGIRPGETYSFCGNQYTYTGLDIINDQLDDLSRDFPDLVNTANVDRMLSDPLGFTPPPFQLDPSIVAALTGDVDSLLGGAVGGALYGALASINDPFCGPQYTSKSQIENAVKGALIGGAAGGIAGALGGLAGNFLPAGIDAPVQAVKAAIDGVTKALPFKAAGAADIVNQIVLVKTLMNIGVKGPGAIIFAAVKSNFLSDIPGVSEVSKALNLQSEVASLARLASNPIAFAAQAALISKNFPMINVNKIASNMISGAITGALGGAGFNIKSMIPNMSLAKGLVGILPIPGITPVIDALKPIKTAKPPKPKPPVRLKNLFAEAAAGSAMSTLKQPLSQFMGILSTVAPQTNLTSDTASKTSYGEQKLNGNSNTANWSSGGYSRNTTTQLQEKRRLDISAKIENETQELLSQVDYSKLTRYSYQDLVKKHPRITPTTSVLESLIIIEEDEAKLNASITTA